MADAAPAATEQSAAAGGVDQVMDLLRGSGLELRPHQIENALRGRPGDPIAAAHTVLAWKRAGKTRATNAGTLLLAALRTQAARGGLTNLFGVTRHDPLVRKTLADHPGMDLEQVIKAVYALRTFARQRRQNPGLYDGSDPDFPDAIPPPDLSPAGVRQMLRERYGRQAVGV